MGVATALEFKYSYVRQDMIKSLHIALADLEARPGLDRLPGMPNPTQVHERVEAIPLAGMMRALTRLSK